MYATASKSVGPRLLERILEASGFGGLGFRGEGLQRSPIDTIFGYESFLTSRGCLMWLTQEALPSVYAMMVKVVIPLNPLHKAPP